MEIRFFTVKSQTFFTVKIEFSIDEIKVCKNLFESYFAQMGSNVNIKHPFSSNYLKINEKIKKLDY